MKICSLNIRYRNENDGNHHWENRRPLIQNFINETDIEILGTQEGRKDQIYDLAKDLKLELIDGHRNWITERMYPTLFYNKTLYQLVSSGDIWLSTTPHLAGSSSFESAFPRLLTWAILENKNESFLIANFHLDHVKNSTRIEQSKIGTHELNLINSKKHSTIVIGDFNDDPQGNVHNEICTSLNLRDPWCEINEKEETSHHNFQGENFQGTRIDWLLISKNINCEEIHLDKRNQNGIYLSDHFPVVATLIPN